MRQVSKADFGNVVDLGSEADSVSYADFGNYADFVREACIYGTLTNAAKIVDFQKGALRYYGTKL